MRRARPNRSVACSLRRHSLISAIGPPTETKRLPFRAAFGRVFGDRSRKERRRHRRVRRYSGKNTLWLMP
jgi:hypothetical protein